MRAAFTEQAGACDRLGSPFTAFLCRTIAARLDRPNAMNRALATWQGNPSPRADNLPLRIAAALHALTRSGRAPLLRKLYPPAPLPDPERLYDELVRAVDAEADFVTRFLASAPQTNEVNRSAVLMAGYLEIAARTGLPLSLFEIGSSAGLNLVPERYRYTFGQAVWGNADALLHLAPEWHGNPPATAAPLRIAARRGCDRSPIDVADPGGREALVAYVWADQADRLRRIEQAIAIASTARPPIDRSSAADWVETRICETERGTCRVLFHSIVWSYLSPDEQARITEHMETIGQRTTPSSPLAWLRFELDPEAGAAALRLRLWPSGEDHLLATADGHGTRVTWLA